MKKPLFFFLFFCFSYAALAQDTFIKEYSETTYGRNMRVIPTPDEGWVVFSLDSAKLFKFNKCGYVEWAKKYQVNQYVQGDFIKAKNGNFLYLGRKHLGNDWYVSSLTMIEPNGNVKWSKRYEDANYNQVPYTISEDKDGNFILFANSDHVGPGFSDFLHTILKINPLGNIIWSKSYALSFFNPIWGGALTTADNGILARTGQVFLKTDKDGAVQWVSRGAAGGNDTYYAPVEVSDGYIFTGYRFSSGKLDFYKIDKQGNLVGANKKTLSFAGLPVHLQKNSSGNIVGVFQQLHTSQQYPTIVELDKDLNIVQQNALKVDPLAGELASCAVGIMSSNAVLVAGLTKPRFSADISNIFVARANASLRISCDTTGTIALTTEPAAQSFTTATPANHTFTAVNQTVAVKNLSVFTQTLCGTRPKLSLNIRRDTLLCESGTLEIKDTSGQAFDSFLWSTGEKTAGITVNKPGKYWLKATYNCTNEVVTDTVIIKTRPFPTPKLNADSVICGGNLVRIDATLPEATYTWQDGSTNAIYYAAKPGNYTVEISRYGCRKQFTATVTAYENLIMPNIFTPSGDRLNEIFKPKEFCGIASGTLTIYNRWGQQLFQTHDILSGWNGFVKGKEAGAGIYYWSIQYTNFNNQQKRQKGWVEVVKD